MILISLIGGLAVIDFLTAPIERVDIGQCPTVTPTRVTALSGGRKTIAEAKRQKAMNDARAASLEQQQVDHQDQLLNDTSPINGLNLCSAPIYELYWF